MTNSTKLIKMEILSMQNGIMDLKKECFLVPNLNFLLIKKY